MQKFVLTFFAAALAIPGEETTRRLVTISCTVSQRSYAAPWEVWTSSTVEQPAFLTEPFVLSFAADLLADSDCSVLSAGGAAQKAEVVRYDRRLDLVVLKVADKAFWKDAPGPVQRAGVLPLGAKATCVTGPVFRALDAQLTVFGPKGGPGGMRVVAGLAPAPTWDGFLVDSYGRLVGLVSKGTVTPEYTLGQWDQVAPVPVLGLGMMPSENPTFRKRYGVPEDRGVLIMGASPAWSGVAETGDALVAVAGNDVGHDATVHVDALGVRLSVSAVPYAIPEGFNVTIRAGDKEFQGPVQYYLDSPEPPPSFLIVGGMVFAPPTNALLEELQGNWLLRVPDSVPGTGVVLVNVLAHSVNFAFPTDTVRGLHSCNGERIESLAGLQKLVASDPGFIACSFVATSSSDQAIGVVGDETPPFPDFVFDSAELKKVGEEILGQYNVPASMSMDLCGGGALDERTEKACALHKKGSLLQRPGHGFLRGAGGTGWPRDTGGRVAWGGHEHRDVELASKELGERAELDSFGPGEGASIAKELLEREQRVQGGAEPEPVFPEAPGRARDLPADHGDGPVPLRRVVKILTTAAKQSFLVPWRFLDSSSMTGSGIMVHGEDFGVKGGRKLILTNAHVVNGHQNVLIQRQDLARKIQAKVLVIAPDVDMAVLEVEDEELWEDVGALPSRASVPAANSLVRVAGYPLGGNAVSITNGVVSRVIGMGYEFNQPHNLVNAPGAVVAVQVDAAINPGNSGGPVFDNQGAFVGLAFAGMRGADNMGFVIPAEVVKARLPSLLDPASTGIADLGFAWRKLENPTMRRYLKLEDTGVLVQSTAPLGPLAGKLNPGDVLLEVDGHSVAGDGTVLVAGSSRAADLRLPLDALVSGKADGAATKLLVRRAPEQAKAESKEGGEDAKAEKAEKAESEGAEDAKAESEEDAEDGKAEGAFADDAKAGKAAAKKTSVVRALRHHVPQKAKKPPAVVHHTRRARKASLVDAQRHGAGNEELSVNFITLPPRVPRYDTVPSYVVVGGLVFSKFTVPLLNAYGGSVGPVPPATQRTLDNWRRNSDEDVVVLLDALRGPVNEFYSFPRMSILHSLNGEPVTSLPQLVELLPAAFKAEFLEFSFDASGFSEIVLDAAQAADDTELLSSNAVPAPASADLVELWCKSNGKGAISAWAGC